MGKTEDYSGRTISTDPVQIRHKVIKVNIGKLYRNDMTPLELYEYSRGIWVLGERRNKAEYVIAVFKGIVREVYRIEQWHPAGTLKYQTRDSTHFKDSGRWEFSGVVADEIRDEYVNYFVGKSSHNPIRYVNI